MGLTNNVNVRQFVYVSWYHGEDGRAPKKQVGTFYFKDDAEAVCPNDLYSISIEPLHFSFKEFNDWQELPFEEKERLKKESWLTSTK